MTIRETRADGGASQWLALIEHIGGGKVVGGARYLHLSAAPAELVDAVRAAVAAVGGPADGFNVLKLVLDAPRLSLLNYPSYFELAFPLLADSWTLDLAAGTCDHRSYPAGRNPPVLHRKELLLAPDHPRRAEFAALTAAAEGHALFANALTIGHRNQWEALVRAKGLRVDGHALVALENPEATATVLRHRTAMARRALSTPMQALWRHGYLAAGNTVFDYGCGRGDDLAALASHGVEARGWDPYFRPEAGRDESDVVNLGFVLNVIEDPGERREALARAYGLARKVLAVSALLGGRAAEERHLAYGDGVLTSRSTFQKYFGHEELGEYIAGALGREPVSVGPGLFFVFRRDEDEQDFLEGRQRSSGRYGVMPTTPARPVVERERAARAARPKSPTRWEKGAALVEDFWRVCLELGRVPREGEFARLGELTREVASAPVVLRRLTEERGGEALAAARARRMGDLSVFLGLNMFERRRSAGSWGARAQVDLREFWGSYPKATEAGQALLFSLRDAKTIAAAGATAAAQGFGWLVEGESLQVDGRLVNELPPALRVYLGCAGKLYGEVQGADVVKLHIGSGKVSLMRYDDYEGSAIPLLVERVKVDLRRQQVSYYRYERGGEFEPQPLYMKSRYMHPAMEGYAGQRGFDEGLEAAAEAAGVDWGGYGPPVEALRGVLAGMTAPAGMRVMGG
ncbi:MAG: hypothetical protein JWM10_1026 [Myxococcaceae bacterium]|nr:hypothetical protein [Myxococcaceae bacterium]